jgi:hypothetical protein
MWPRTTNRGPRRSVQSRSPGLKEVSEDFDDHGHAVINTKLDKWAESIRIACVEFE